MNNQIDSSSHGMGGAQPNADKEKLDMMDKANEFMNNTEIKKRIKQLAGRGTRLNLDIDEIRSYDPRLSKYIVKHPIEAIKMFEDELNQSIRALEQEEKNEKTQVQSSDVHFPKKITTYYINFKGNIGRNYVTPRGLKSNLVNEMVQVQGIVTKITFVRPRIQTSVHYCETTKRGLIKNYNDKYNLAEQADAEGTGELNNAVPTKDNNDNPLSLEYGYCIYKDSQTITIQEMPENSPPGQLPRSIDVVLENDLVDSCKPGDRVQVTGVFRVMHVGTAGRLRNYLVATGIESLIAEKEKPFMSERDIKEIRKLAKDKDAFNILGESVAPSIEGHFNVKKAILLQLLGGREKILNNGTHLRGDVNIMMVGDPSTAKSQFLRHIMDIAPLALNTTGRGSSGVGLTAAVGIDKETGDKKLEAGAMVLADRGIICIDEFDKMNDIDRVAIHEVMEQQTVTIAKAGIHTTLNARCSVIAAANPLYSEYARDISVGKNIGLPDSLLSRFDLIFIMLDEKDPELDRQIAERVITNHRYQSNEGDIASLFNYMNKDCVIEADLKLDKNANSKQQVYEKNMVKVTGGVQRNVLTRDFLKKYLSFVKSQKNPELHEDCVDYASVLYSVIRAKAVGHDQNKVSSPVTVRTLETIIRLATAHAKLRMSKIIEQPDIDIAVNMVHMSIFGEDLGNENEDQQQEKKAEDAVMQDDVVDLGKGQPQPQPIQVQKNARNTRALNRQQAASVNKEGAAPPEPSSKKRVKFTAGTDNEEDEEVVMDDPKGTDATPGGPSSTSRPIRRSAAQSLKKMKIDEEQQVKDLFEPSQANDVFTFPLSVKKYVFKLITEVKVEQNKSKVPINAVWQKFFQLDDEAQKNPNTGKVFFQSKQELQRALESMEVDDLIVINNDDIILLS